MKPRSQAGLQALLQAHADSGLRAVVEAWPNLPERTRRAILALIASED